VTAVVNLEKIPLPLAEDVVIGDAKQVGAGSASESALVRIVR